MHKITRLSLVNFSVVDFTGNSVVENDHRHWTGMLGCYHDLILDSTEKGDGKKDIQTLRSMSRPNNTKKDGYSTAQRQKCKIVLCSLSKGITKQKIKFNT